MMNVTIVLLILAVVCFFLATILVPAKINLVALGLFFLAGATLYKAWIG